MKPVTKEALDWLTLAVRGDFFLNTPETRQSVQRDLAVNLKKPKVIVENHCRRVLDSNQESVIQKYFKTKKFCIEYVVRQTKLIGTPDIVETHFLQHQPSPFEKPPSIFELRQRF